MFTEAVNILVAFALTYANVSMTHYIQYIYIYLQRDRPGYFLLLFGVDRAAATCHKVPSIH